MKKTAIKISIIAIISLILLFTTFFIVSKSVTVEVDKWVYTNILGKSDFEKTMYKENYNLLTRTVLITNNNVHHAPNKSEYFYNITGGTQSESATITFNNEKVYASCFITIDHTERYEIFFEGTRTWWFQYEWKLIENENFPNLDYEMKASYGKPLKNA